MRYFLLAALLAFLPSTALAQSVGNGPPVQLTNYYASTATGANTSGTAGTYGNFACQTGSTNCSSGTISFTTGISQGINNEWLVTVFMVGSTVQLTTQLASLCAFSTSTFTVLDATWAQTGVKCIGSPSNMFAGSVQYADSALTAPGLQGMAIAHLIVANSTAFAMTCGSTVNTGSAATIYGFCSAYAVSF